MFNILWFLYTIVPEWIYYLILITGIVGLLVSGFLQTIPGVRANSQLIKIVSVVLCIVGIWLNGTVVSNNMWQHRVKELEDKVAKAEAQARVINTEIETVYVDRIKVVKEKEYIIQSEIREYSVDIDKNCSVSPRAIEILNSAARSSTVDTKK